MRSLILLALVAAAVAAPKESQRIVGGQPANIEDFPFMTNMQHRRFGIIWTHECGGTLITTTRILSAGHCYYRDSTSSWRVLLGTSETSSGGTQHNVAQITLHPQYDDDTYEADVAILLLSAAAALSNTIGVVNLAGPNYNPNDGAAVTTLGYGRTSVR